MRFRMNGCVQRQRRITRWVLICSGAHYESYFGQRIRDQLVSGIHMGAGRWMQDLHGSLRIGPRVSQSEYSFAMLTLISCFSFW